MQPSLQCQREDRAQTQAQLALNLGHYLIKTLGA